LKPRAAPWARGGENPGRRCERRNGPRICTRSARFQSGLLRYKRLIDKVPLADVSSSFVMEEIKATTALPLQYMARKRSPG
jgi:hypothetical protein